MTKHDPETYPSFVSYHPRYLKPTRKTAPKFNAWETEVRGAERRRNSDPFWRADLMLMGAMWFGEDRITSAFDVMEWGEGAIKTWLNAFSIGRRIPPKWWNERVLGTDELSRRRDELSYSHHALVAYLEPEEQIHYLEVAIENSLSVRKLRDLIRFDQGKEIKFETHPLIRFLEGEADKIERRMEDAEGDVRDLMQTAVDSLRDAHEVQADSEAMERAA